MAADIGSPGKTSAASAASQLSYFVFFFSSETVLTITFKFPFQNLPGANDPLAIDPAYASIISPR
ncbi:MULTISPECIES: hypothetical protein [Sphingobacterium]|uniref:hypothetical protein n=1 Tax=Sphingobacterium TaxID=28453 RepID=UPI00257F34A2|nr:MULTISPECIES: hypothetical protein [Sphingobacterium]